MYNPQEPCPHCLEVTGCDCEPVIRKRKRKKEKRQRPGSDFFNADWNDEVYIQRKIANKGGLGGRKLG